MPKQKKDNNALTIAIIGLVGTLVAAALGSPVLVEYIKSKQAMETPAAAIPTPVIQVTDQDSSSPVGTNQVLIFSQDFEKGITSGFAFEEGTWEVTKDKSNRVLQGEGTDPGFPGGRAYFGSTNFVNGVIEFKLKFIQFGDLYADFRLQNSGTYVLYFRPVNQHLVLASNMPVGADWELLELNPESVQPFSFQEKVWYTVQLQVLGNHFIVTIDGNRILSTYDDRLKQGRLRFTLEPGTKIMLDDVQVWALE